jgi:hypothetical protein
MKAILLALPIYVVSLAVLIFQFIVPGYSDLLFYGQLVLHAVLWLIVYRLSSSPTRSRTLAIVASIAAALVFSLAPFDITIPSLFNPATGQAWLSVVLRTAIHAACLVVMATAVRKAKSAG